MAARQRSLLPLLIGLASVLLLAATLVVLEATGSSDGGEVSTLERPVPSAGRDRRIEAYQGGGGNRPPAQVAERVVVVPPRIGPDKIILAVVDDGTNLPVSQYQLNVVPWAEGDPLERLGSAIRQPIRRKDGVIGVDQEPGRYDVVVIAPGYQHAVLRDVQVPALDARPLPVRLQRGPGIAGTVYDEDGLLRADVPVFLSVVRLYDPESALPELRRVNTGVDGSFAFAPLPPGEYAVALLEPDNTSDRVAGLRVSDGTTRIELLLGARHRVAFRVEDETGRPQPQARVELRSAGHFASGTTNEAGVALVDDLIDGTYQVTLRHPEFVDLTDELDLIGGMGQHIQNLRFEQRRPR